MTTALVASVMLLAAAACADDGPSSARSATVVVPPTNVAPSENAAGAPADGSAPTSPAVEPTGVVVEVVAIDNTFRPDVVEVEVGDEVVFVNRGRNEHDALSVDGADWGVHVDDFGPGDEYRHVFAQPGEYRYYCSIHGTAEVGMIGTVIVRDT